MDIFITKKITQEIERVKSGTALFGLKDEEKFERIKKAKTEGTTILALTYNEGIIVAADRRCVAGSTIFSDKEIKIDEIGSFSCIASSGWVSDCQLIVEILRRSMADIEDFWNTQIFIDGQIGILQFLMQYCLFLTWPILAGWNPFQKTGRISLVEPGGALFEPKDYAAFGSGENFARTILENNWVKNCPEKKAIELAIEALMVAANNNIHTSDPLRRPPTIKIISASGISTLSDNQILKIAWRIFFQKQARRKEPEELAKFMIECLMREENLKGERKK